MPHLLCILTLSLLIGAGVEPAADWPIVTDKSTGIELEFPGEFVSTPQLEDVAFGGQAPDGTAAMAVISSSEAKVELPEDMLAKAMSALALTQLNPSDREELSTEDTETFQVESGFRQEFTAQRDGKPASGIIQYIVYHNRSALIITCCVGEQWEKMRPILLFSLDTAYIW